MPLPKRYTPETAESELERFWSDTGVYHFDPVADRPAFTIDTPPPTVSGQLHLGHVYSYSHADFIARFWRMNGREVYYPIGYDDNGLPTERLVEKRLGITAQGVGRQAFIEKCLEIGEEAEREYQALWRRLGLSVDWRHTYRTIDELSRRTAQWSFLDLLRKDLVFRRQAPTIWCPECRTAIAQAELNDLELPSEFVTLAFQADADVLPIATTRPELLPACVAVFVHPSDERFAAFVGRQAQVPLFGQRVPILADEVVDPEKGTGAVMCCTFGDTTDIEWWYRYHLPLVEAIGRDGRMTDAAGRFAGLAVPEARKEIGAAAEAEGRVLARRAISHAVRVHERDDVPVEYIVTGQWFVKVLEFRDQLLRAGEEVRWFPAHMQARYRDWVEGLSWDWAISRQRYFGVPFPLWYCDACGEVVPAEEGQLPLDPSDAHPPRACGCGNGELRPETDVFDTWFTSSLSPQIIGRFLTEPEFFARTFPMTMRPQAHEIIRTWAFYTIVKSLHHLGRLPWRDVAISGWGLAGEGMEKISKSRGGGPMSPMEMIGRYSADAVRYWAASTGLGKDSVISEDKVQVGAKLVTKLWNVAGFSGRFIEGYDAPDEPPAGLSPADRWILSRTHRLVRRCTELFHGYDYAAAKAEVEVFFWRDLADNYLELAKHRLYDPAGAQHEAARWTLRHVLLATLKLFAPFLPYVTETVYRGLFATEEAPTIHRAPWPRVDEALIDDAAEAVGDQVVEIATAVRRYKSDRQLALGTELAVLQLGSADGALAERLRASLADLKSVTRAREIAVVDGVDPALDAAGEAGAVAVAVGR
ncbi:MAG TPA: valine--tRNA ligase [Longimicrobiaceae bacterium]|nr:valine--tRNA ligase [Longimicrobiaceae bacterium]